LWLLRNKSDQDPLDSSSSRKPHSAANSAEHPKCHNAFISFAGISEEINEHAPIKLGHDGSEDCHAEARSHVPRSITSSDTRHDSSSCSMRFHSKKVAVRKHLPIRRERADVAVRAIRGDEQHVEPEHRRDLQLVMREVLLERRARGHAGLLQFDDYQSRVCGIDEAHQIRPASVECADDADQQEIIVRRMLLIDYAQQLCLLPAACRR